MDTKSFVIIGNSAAGLSAAEAMRGKDKKSNITIISDEEYNAYCRCLISYFLAGGIPEEKLFYLKEGFYKENNLKLMLNKKVVRVEPKKNRVVLDDKTAVNYDSLLIATGSSAKIPEDLKGVNKKGVLGFRTINNAKEILSLVPFSSTSCILGGGLIGLKAAYGLLQRKQELKVIVKSNFVLSQMLDEKSAGIFMKRFQDSGIEIVTGRDIVEILGNGDLKAVKLDSGKVIACSILIIAKGVKPNTALVKDTQINTDKGILVDEYMRTNVANVFAAGDVAETYDVAYRNNAVNALWPNAVEQGKIAGLNMLDKNVKYDGSIAMNSIEFFNLPAISMGITMPKGENFQELVFFDEKKDIYRKVVLSGNRVVGMIAVGDIKNSGVFLHLIKEGVEISSIKDELVSESFSYAKAVDLLKPKDKVYIY